MSGKSTGKAKSTAAPAKKAAAVKIDPVPAANPEKAIVPVVEEQVVVDNVVLFEKIYDLRFVDKDGNFSRLEDYKAGGIYILRSA